MPANMCQALGPFSPEQVPAECFGSCPAAEHGPHVPSLLRASLWACITVRTCSSHGPELALLVDSGVQARTFTDSTAEVSLLSDTGPARRQSLRCSSASHMMQMPAEMRSSGAWSRPQLSCSPESWRRLMSRLLSALSQACPLTSRIHLHPLPFRCGQVAQLALAQCGAWHEVNS